MVLHQWKSHLNYDYRFQAAGARVLRHEIMGTATSSVPLTECAA